MIIHTFLYIKNVISDAKTLEMIYITHFLAFGGAKQLR